MRKRLAWGKLLLGATVTILLLGACGKQSNAKDSTSKSATSSSVTSKKKVKKPKKTEAELKADAENEAAAKVIFNGISITLGGDTNSPTANYDKSAITNNLATYFATKEGADPTTVTKIVKDGILSQMLHVVNLGEDVETYGPEIVSQAFGDYYNSGASLTGAQEAALEKVKADFSDVYITTVLSASSEQADATLEVSNESGSFSVKKTQHFNSLPSAQTVNVRDLVKDHLCVSMEEWPDGSSTPQDIYIDQATMATINKYLGTPLPDNKNSFLHDVMNETYDFKAGDSVTINFDAIADTLTQNTPSSASVKWYGDGQGPVVLKPAEK